MSKTLVGRTQATRVAGRRWVRYVFAAIALVAILCIGWAAWLSVPRGTFVSPHTAVAIGRCRNVLWCATGQLAWDRAVDLNGEKLEIPGASDPAAVGEMNRHPFPSADLDPHTFVAVAGTGENRIGDRFKTALESTFGKVPESVTIPDVPPGKAAALAYLLKQLRFTVPFPVSPEPMTFRTGPLALVGRKGVRAFGYLDSQPDGGPESMALHPNRDRIGSGEPLAQVRLHWQDDPSDPSEYIFELRPTTQDRILLARIAPADTLEETWNRVAARCAGAGTRVPGFDRFLVPTIDVGELRAHFESLTGSIVSGRLRNGALKTFEQWTKFRLDETGARLESFSGITMTQGLGPSSKHPSYVFDRPFLLALIQKGATRPYFLLWIGNPDLLVAAD